MSVDDILTIKLNSNDNVATAFNNITKGEITQNIKAENDIPKGHKIALKKKADSNVIATIANQILADTSLEESEKK